MAINDSFEMQLSSAAFFDNPHTIFHEMRSVAPVYWSNQWNAWVLTRYDDVMQVLRDSEHFSSAGRVSYLLDNLPDDVRVQLTRLEKHYEIGLAHSDPPDHTRLRKLLNKVFTPRMVERWRPRIQKPRCMRLSIPCRHNLSRILFEILLIPSRRRLSHK